MQNNHLQTTHNVTFSWLNPSYSAWNVFLLFCNLNSKSYKNKFSKIKKAYAKDSWKRHETGALRLMKWLFASLMLLWLLDGRISHTWFYALKMFIWVHSYIHTWKIKLFPHGLPLGIRIPFNFEKAPFHFDVINIS